MEKHTRKNIVSGVITLLILLAGIMIFLKLQSMKKSTVSDEVVKKERRKVKFENYLTSAEPNEVELDGRLLAHERVSITSKVQGVMQPGSKSVRSGMYFNKGEVLFSIDNREANFNVKALRSNLMTAITQMMPDLKFDYPQSFANWEQYLTAFSIDQSTQKLPDPMSQQEKYFVAGRNIYNQFYNIKSQETRLSEYNIYAPFSGVVTDVNVFPGALVNPNQALATMLNTSRYEVAAPVPLDNTKYIKVGQKVELRSDDLDKSWIGTVSRVGTQIDPTTQNLPVYITVRGKGLKDGMYLKGSISAGSLEAVTKLPKDIFLTPTSVYVIQDSMLVAKDVSTVKRTANHVLVNNITPEDKVVTGSLAGLFEGQKVNY